MGTTRPSDSKTRGRDRVEVSHPRDPGAVAQQPAQRDTRLRGKYLGIEFHGASDRPEILMLYLRLAETLDRSAELAQEHCRRLEREGRSGTRELDSAERAHLAAARARALASEFRAPPR